MLNHRRRFNPRPRAGGDAELRTSSLTAWSFNPRPRAGATYSMLDVPPFHCVSIHAPARGATVAGYNDDAAIAFQSTPRAGGDLVAQIDLAQDSVSIHAPARGATAVAYRAASRDIRFNPRPARGATYGLTGQQARGDVNYRITRKTTIGAYYSFSHYLYPHGFGNSDTDTFGAIYSYAINRSMQIRFRGGISDVNSVGLVTVAIAPPIAALLGVSSGVIDSWTTYRTTDISAQFVNDFRHGRTASLAYARGVTPGNGVYQTSRRKRSPPASR